MKLVELSIRAPVSVAVGVILITLFGMISLRQIPVQLTPEVEQPRVTVETLWPGASPQEVEREITDRQEEQLKNVEGLLEMTSESQDGTGSIVLEFPVGSDMDTAVLLVANALEQVRQSPQLAEKPVIYTVDRRANAIAWLTLKRLPGNERSMNGYRDLCEDVIKPAFERIPGIARSGIFGGTKQELRVVIDPQKLSSLRITTEQVISALRRENRDISAGDFDEGKRRYIVRTLGEYESAKDVQDVVIVHRNNRAVHVRDVGTAYISYQKPDFTVQHFGSPSIAMNCQRATGANVIKVMVDLRRTVSELNQDLLKAQGVKLTQAYDETIYITSAIKLVRQNIIFGGLLAVGVLFLFLRSRSGVLVIATAIPISIVGTFLVMSMLGRNINVISLAGMSFAVGMVVDNAIVVLENIIRHRQTDKGRRTSAHEGTSEVWGAILASTLTTMAVFIPIVFMKEEIGQLYRDIAIAISSAVALSMIVSITVIPTLAARIIGSRGDRAAQGSDRKRNIVDRAAEAFTRAISDLVYWLCGRTWTRLTIAIVLTGAALLLSRVLIPPAEYLPQGSRNLVFSIMLPPPGYNLTELSRLGVQIESDLQPHFPIYRDVPNANPTDPVFENFFFVARGRNVFMGAVARDDSAVQDIVPVMRKPLSEVPGMIAIVQQASLFGRSIGQGRNIDLQITGPDLAQLVGFGQRIFGQLMGLLPDAQMRPIPGLDLGNPEINIVPDRVRAAKLGMSTEQIGILVDVFLDGRKIDDYKYEGEEIDLVLSGERDSTMHSQDLATIPIATPGGKLVTLASLAEIRVTTGPEQINHIERRRAITISIIPPPSLPLEEAMQTIRQKVIQPLEDSGEIGGLYRIEMAGTADDLVKTRDALKWNLLLAVVISYLLMAALFESFLYPFVIMFSVPLAGVGGLLGLRLMNLFQDQALDTLTMLGFVILIGTVVNNAILIVHQALNHIRRDSMHPREAIRESVRTRIRPIFMSTTTSVLGMTPLVVFSGAGSELYRGIGSVVIGGLVVSTVFTLILVPTLFSLVLSARAKLLGSAISGSAQDLD
ncbi:MAG: efflux RND transporter permease subunit [Verrucomicrobia bacterium]|nr:efflux RND transporter permease subunit [Verrucomicrobiota bacterium]MDA1087971.1 efflux RND transporter permease subunit [Verrucomicrobiota bacterium]